METLTIIGIIGSILGIASSIGYFYEKVTVIFSKTDNTKGKPIFSLPFLSVFSKLTWAQAIKTAKTIAQRVETDDYKATLVIGIGRGGAIL